MEQIKNYHWDVFKTVTTSFGLTVEQSESFHFILEHAIEYFDELLELKLNEPGVVPA